MTPPIGPTGNGETRGFAGGAGRYQEWFQVSGAARWEASHSCACSAGRQALPSSPWSRRRSLAGQASDDGGMGDGHPLGEFERASRHHPLKQTRCIAVPTLHRAWRCPWVRGRHPSGPRPVLQRGSVVRPVLRLHDSTRSRPWAAGRRPRFGVTIIKQW